MAIEPLEDNGIIKNQQNNFFRKKKKEIGLSLMIKFWYKQKEIDRQNR